MCLGSLSTQIGKTRNQRIQLLSQEHIFNQFPSFCTSSLSSFSGYHPLRDTKFQIVTISNQRNRNSYIRSRRSSSWCKQSSNISPHSFLRSICFKKPLQRFECSSKFHSIVGRFFCSSRKDYLSLFTSLNHSCPSSWTRISQTTSVCIYRSHHTIQTKPLQLFVI